MSAKTQTGSTAPAKTPARAWEYRRDTGENDPLYVVNKVTTTGREAGPIVIPVEGDNDTRTVNILSTWVPQDLSNQALPTHITRTMEFRNLVTRGILEVLEPSEAEGILASGRAQAELRRLTVVAESKLGGKAPTGAATIRDARDMNKDLSGALASQNPDVNAKMRPGESTAIAPNVGVELLDRFNRGDITEEQAATSMAAVGMVLTPDEKLRLKQVQNLPEKLLDAVAAL